MFAFPLLLLLGCTSAVSATSKLSLDLWGGNQINGVNNLKVVTTVTNTGDETLKLLNDPRGPLSQMPTETFDIIHQDSGASPAFSGIRVKYVPSVAMRIEQDGAFTVLAPGQSVNVEHDLGAAYNFASSGPGSYSLRASNSFTIVDSATGTLSFLTAENPQPHVMSINGELTVPQPTKTKRETYTGCGVSEQSTIVAAVAAAQSYADAAFNYLNSHNASTARYNTWFGAYSTANHDTVLTHFSNLNNKSYADYTFDCTCTIGGVYAYVHPDQYGIVTLCGAFWQAPVTGTDSQGGTLVHESTHFLANAGTQDIVYGQTDAMSLAQTDPTEAIDNADNHEYFAENNPFLA